MFNELVVNDSTVSNFIDELKVVMDTYKITTDCEYKYVLGINKIANRELDQLAPFFLPDTIIDIFSDKTKFINNNILCNNNTLNIISPYIIFEINSTELDIESYIQQYMLSIINSDLYISGALEILVYINISSIWEYNYILEVMERDYPNIKVVSTFEVDMDFNLEKNILLSSEVLAKPVATLVEEFKDIINAEVSKSNKIFYIKADTDYKSPLTLMEIIGLFEYNDLPFSGSKSVIEVYSHYQAKLYFRFDDTIKTFYEYIKDIYLAPSCILIKGLTPCVGVIKKTFLSISALDLDKNIVEKIELASDDEITPVGEELVKYFKKDFSNIRTYLFKYQGKCYRVLKSTLSFNVDCYVSGISSRYNTTIEYSDSIYFLSKYFGGNLYSKLIQSNSRLRPTILPNNYFVYLVRRLRLPIEELKKLDIKLEDVAFWSHRNSNIAKSLRLLVKLMSLDSLVSNNIFDINNGFMSNIVLPLNKLGGEIIE